MDKTKAPTLEGVPNDNELIYGIYADLLGRLINKPFTILAYVDGYGVRKITNTGATTEVKVIDGVNKKLLGEAIVYFSQKDYEDFGLDLKEAKVRTPKPNESLPSILDDDEDINLETTQVRLKVGATTENKLDKAGTK